MSLSCKSCAGHEPSAPQEEAFTTTNGAGDVLLPEMVHRRIRGIVYGPVVSRRLGRSLGLDVLPWGVKRCSLDCVYCEVGSAPAAETTEADVRFPAVDTVLAELASALQRTGDLDTITFSGSGEPTLHPRFAELVAGVVRLRDRHAPHAKVTVLSNGTRAARPEVRSGLLRADVRLMKLDAGDEATFQAINRPAPALHIAQISANLRALDEIVVQTMLLDGVVSNVHPAALSAYIAALRAIEPAAVQLYSISRSVPLTGIRAVPHETLQAIAQQIETQTQLPVHVYG